MLPQLEVITMQAVSKSKANYGQIRLWGSVGFICLTIAVGKALDVYSTDTPVVVSIGVLACLFLITLFISAPGLHRKLKLHRVTYGSTCGSVLSPYSFLLRYVYKYPLAPIMVFALYLRDLGYSGQQTGLFIALGVLAEVGIFLIAGRLIRTYGVWNLLLPVSP